MIEDTMFDYDCYAVFMEEEHEKEKRVRDNISRQAAIRWVKTECNPYGKPTLDFESGKKVIEHLEQMPSADRPSGHWVLVNRGLNIYMCDRCGEILQIDRVPIWDYCPLCGARMGGETDGRPN